MLTGTKKFSTTWQFITGILLIASVAGVCFLTSDVIGYKVVALILLLVVSLLAMTLDILPVLCASVLSALVWNFFFIPPIFTFHIDNTEDILLFLMYFVIALVNAVLTFKIRAAEKKARDKEEKENTIKLYNTLLNSLSHELRTPIATILGAVDTLKENKEKLSSTQQAELLAGIDLASIRLNRQVENLLNVSRLETGMLQPKLDWVDANELIHTVMQKLDPAKGNHQFIFTPNEQLPLFKLDHGLMEEVLHNILHNAVQYTPHNSNITINAKCINENCVITVEDNGPGFPPEQIQFLFDKFYRLPNSKTGGTGIGLSIAKGFTEAHKGKITVENCSTGGAKFTITVPVQTSFINNLKNE
jgi:two-component system, OmpR family, sensor histidine kinase KdpD